VRIPLRTNNRYCLAVLACIITSTPGTLWMAHDTRSNVLLLHVLDLVDEQRWIELIQQRYERLLREIFV
jgi:multicomponent K+:H+ antiporter subunit E